MDLAGRLHALREGAPPLGAIVSAMRRDPEKLGILFACTMAVVATVFEPPYLTLSTSVIQAGLRAQESAAPLTFATACLLLALLTLLAGTSADIFGRRRLLLAGLAGLTVSNALGLLWMDTPNAFAAADVLNSISGVVVLPAAIAIVTLTFEEALRPFAYAILFSIQGAALVVGMFIIPMLGGVWEGRATFIPVLILGIIAFVLALRRISESRAPESLRRGSIVVNLVLMAGLFLILFLIITNGIRSEETAVAVLVAAGLLLFASVVRWLARRSRHFRGVQVYGGRDLGLAILSGFMTMFAQGCFFFQITPFFFNVQQVGDVEGALRFVPYVIGLVAGGVLVARLALRFGARRILVLSFLLSGAGLLALSLLQVDSPFWVMIVPTAVVGMAMGMAGPARTTVVMSAPPEGLVSSSAAVNTAAAQGGYTLGVIVSSVLVTQNADQIFVDGLAAAGVSADTIARVSSGLQSAWSRLLATRYPELPDAVKAVTDVSYATAFTHGMTRMFLLVALTMFVTAIVIFFGMHRGLRATLSVPAEDPLAADDSRITAAE